MVPEPSHPHDWRWIDGQLSRLPRRFRAPVAKRYAQTFTAHPRFGRRNANIQLRRLVESIPRVAYGLAADDGALVSFADARARHARGSARDLQPAARFELLAGHVAWLGLAVPEPDGETMSLAGAIGRIECPRWWRRQLRKDHGRKIEGTARDLGLVNKSAGIYSSDETTYRRRGQKTRNRRMLEEVQAVNELGDRFTLAELADLSVSNPVIRRGELMTRIAGFEAVAADMGHHALFVTLTCPGYMHRSKLAGGRGRAIDNPSYKPTTPREAQGYLCKVWGRIRAKLARHGIRLYGFRVAEPNHDGTPHWHFLVFLPAWSRRRVCWEFSRYGLQEAPDERGADRHRVTFVDIDPAKGTAAGYIAKYIAKNIDGFGLDCDLYGSDPIEAAERVDAWAACWGIRQFQQLGGPPVTVWRELRRMDSEETGLLEIARDAADRGDWSAFVRAMGGPTAPRDVLPMRPAYWQELNTETGELPLNRYGDPAAGQLFGVRVGDVYHVTRMHRWEFRRAELPPIVAPLHETDPEDWEYLRHVTAWGPPGRRDAVPVDLSDRLARARSGMDVPPPGGLAFKWDNRIGRAADGIQAGGAAARPWSSVNNCTRHGECQRGEQSKRPNVTPEKPPPG